MKLSNVPRLFRLGFLSLVWVLVCLLAGAAGAQPPPEVPLQVKGGDVKTVKVDKVVIIKEDRLVVSAFPFTVNAPSGGGLYFWTYPTGVTATDRGDSLEISAAPKGNLVVSVKCISPDWDKRKFTTTFGSITVAVGEVPPGPTPPPVPPGPEPPKPDPPTPQPPSPIPAEGFRALIIYESAELSKMPPVQRTILYSKTVHDYLNAKCALSPDGKKKEWWIVDKDTDMSNLAKHWQDAMKRPRTQVPWIIISNGKTGFEGPLPLTVSETVQLLKKYGGD